jgi:hypothetical protein
MGNFATDKLGAGTIFWTATERPIVAPNGTLYWDVTDENFYIRKFDAWVELLTGSSGTGITGTIANHQIAFGTAPNTIGGSNNLTFDSTNNYLLVKGAGTGSFIGAPSISEFRVDSGDVSNAIALTTALRPAAALVAGMSDEGIGFITGSGDGTVFSSVNFLLNGTLDLEASHSSSSGSQIQLTPTTGVIIHVSDAGQGIQILGSTSGIARIGAAAVAGTPNIILLPTATGAAGTFLQTNGANPQQTSWVAAGSVIASGTATMPTGALPANTSSAAVTVAGAGILATDAIEWAFNAAPGTGYTEGVFIAAYVTSGNVNFIQTNPTAVSRTPAAATLNWRVIR